MMNAVRSDRRRTRVLALASALAVAAAAAANASTYNIINIAVPGGGATDYHFAGAINDSGQVILNDEVPNVAYNYTAVDDIYNIHTHVYTPLPSYPGSTANSTEVFDINNSGVMVGDYHASGIQWGGFSLSGGVFAPAGFTSSSYNEPVTISNDGKITGYYLDALQNSHGFLVSGGVTTTLDVPSSWASGTFGLGVNDAGTVVGAYTPLSGPAANAGFIDQGGVFTQLSVPGFTNVLPYQINDSGVIVGTAYNGAVGIGDTGFFDKGGIISLFAVPGALGTDIFSIDANGDIAGTWYDAQGIDHAFVAIAGIPEPASWTMTFLGLLGVGAFLRRRRSALAGAGA